MKTCRSCGKEKAPGEFASAGNGILRPDCRACHNAEQRRRRGSEVVAGCLCCEHEPCTPICLRRCPACQDLDTHPRCSRCGVLVGAHHYEKRMAGSVCGGCAQELAQQPAQRRPGRKAA